MGIHNFNSPLPVNVIWIKSSVDSFFVPTCVPVRVSINKLNVIPNWIVAGLVGVFRNSGSLGTGESYIPVMPFDPLLDRSPCFTNVHFATFSGNPVDGTPSCLAGSMVSFGHTKCI